MEQNTTPLTQVEEITIAYSNKIKVKDRPEINSSSEAYTLLMKVWDVNTIQLIEQFRVLLLNRANRVLGIYTASSGGLTGTIADVRLIFAVALKSGATAILIAHNHPSGNLIPSDADKSCTLKIAQAATLLDITLMDHLIITVDGYYSFKDSMGLY
jgi:DNA repair protein RadC